MGISPHKVLICDRSGQPHHWASAEDAIVLKVKDCISYEMGSDSIFQGGTSRMTGERSRVDVGQIMFLKEVLKYDSRTPPLTNANLFARDLNICAFCGRRYPDSKLSRDHVQPTSVNGANTWENCVTACKPCNHQKADNVLGVARDSDGELLKLLYVPYVPSHVERLILQNRNIIADQMDYLKAMLPKHSRILKQSTILGLESIVDELPVKQKRHFYNSKEMSEMKRSEEIENSKRKRSI